MLARVPIISAYDPSRESMLAYASPSNKIAIMITVLVVSLSKQPLVFIYVFFTLLQAYPTTPAKYF